MGGYVISRIWDIKDEELLDNFTDEEIESIRDGDPVLLHELEELAFDLAWEGAADEEYVERY